MNKTGRKMGCDVVVSWTRGRVSKPPSRGSEVQLSLAIDKRDRKEKKLYNVALAADITR
jgi:hypothetical protein